MKIQVLLAVAATFIFTETAFAQRGYSEMIRKDGLIVSTKWGKARDDEGNRKPALLIGIQNNDRSAKNYNFNLLFYYEGILREQGMIAPSCIEGLKSKVGKITGTYFIPEKFTEEQLKSTDFAFEIDSFEVEETGNCDSDE